MGDSLVRVGEKIDSGLNETYDFLCLVFQDVGRKIWVVRRKKRDGSFNGVSFFKTGVLENGTCDPKNGAYKMIRPTLHEGFGPALEMNPTHNPICQNGRWLP